MGKASWNNRKTRQLENRSRLLHTGNYFKNTGKSKQESIVVKEGNGIWFCCATFWDQNVCHNNNIPLNFEYKVSFLHYFVILSDLLWIIIK